MNALGKTIGTLWIVSICNAASAIGFSLLDFISNGSIGEVSLRFAIVAIAINLASAIISLIYMMNKPIQTFK